MALRTFRKDMLLSTLIIVVGVFLAGLWVGKFLDDFRVDDTTKILVTSELDSESFIIERDFINQFVGSRCEILKPRLHALSENLAEIGKSLTRYDNRNLFDQELYDLLRRRYFLQEIKIYTLKKELHDYCADQDDVTILFFYDVTDNEESLRQGYALDALVRHRQDVTVFSIDRAFKEPTLESVKQYYNITYSPTLIINYALKKENFISEGELRALVDTPSLKRFLPKTI